MKNSNEVPVYELGPVEQILKWLRKTPNEVLAKAIVADEIEARGYLQMEKERTEAMEATVNGLEKQLLG